VDVADGREGDVECTFTVTRVARSESRLRAVC